MRKQKAWIQYTKQGRIVPGSLILSPHRPKTGTWYEVIENICCDTEPAFGVISSRKKAFVKYDSQGNIVPGSLILTTKLPKPGIWKEVLINACCNVEDVSNWYLREVFDGAINPGDITFPDQANQTGSLNPNLVGDTAGSTFVMLYINVFDIEGIDRTDLLSQLVGASGILTLTQGANSVTYSYTDQAFYYLTFITPNDNVGFDYFYLPSQLGSLTVTSPASGDFNLIDPIEISVLPPTTTTTTAPPVYTYSARYSSTTADNACYDPSSTPTVYSNDSSLIITSELFYNSNITAPVADGYYLIDDVIYLITSGIITSIEAPCINLTVRINNSTNFDIPAVDGLGAGEFSIQWGAKISTDDNHPRAWSIGSWPNAAHAVSIENGSLFYWIDGTIVNTIDISSYNYIDTWTYFVITRNDNGKVKTYINGLDTASDINFSDAIPTQGKALYLGSEGNDSVQNGLMSDFIFINGAQWDNVVPTVPLTPTLETKLLIFQGNSLPLELTDNSGTILSGDIINGTGVYNVDSPYSGYQGSISFGVASFTTLPCGTVFTNYNWDGTNYANGDPIPLVTDPLQWGTLSTGAYCYVNNDPNTVAEYGLLYNAYVILDPRGIAPQGWHVPSALEYDGCVLANEGGNMKEIGTTYWDAPNTGATNSYGFNARGAGLRNGSGAYVVFNIVTGYYTSTTVSSPYFSLLAKDLTSITDTIGSGNSPLTTGQSLRFVKD